jgi:predicted anti-sigma-YlaC factor YlaD
MLKTLRMLLILATASTLPAGCDIQRLAVNQTAALLTKAMPAFETDPDYLFVKAAMPGNIKTMEGLYQVAQDNPDLLFMLAQAYTAYALVFLEDEFEAAEDMTDAQEFAQKRARDMYMRGHRFGLKLLTQRHPVMAEAIEKGGKLLDGALESCTHLDVKGLFWTAMPLASAVNLSKEDVEMIARMPQAKAMIAKVLELDPGYYDAAPHMIFGALYGSMGKMLGGDPEKAKKHFEKALELTKRRFLLVQVMYAMTSAVQVQDRPLFDKLLKEVLEAELSIYPEQKLANVAAKRRAKRLQAKADELF